jgi:hypothetical protein
VLYASSIPFVAWVVCSAWNGGDAVEIRNCIVPIFFYMWKRNGPASVKTSEVLYSWSMRIYWPGRSAVFSVAQATVHHVRFTGFSAKVDTLIT